MKAQEDLKSNKPLTNEVMSQIQKYPLHYQASLIKYAQKGESPSQAFEKLKGFEAMM